MFKVKKINCCKEIKHFINSFVFIITNIQGDFFYFVPKVKAYNCFDNQHFFNAVF